MTQIDSRIRHGEVCIVCLQYIEFDQPATYWGNARGEPRLCTTCKELAPHQDLRRELEGARR